MMKVNNKGFLWGAVVGGVIGSVTALLFAPKQGAELRKDIADKSRQVGSKTQELVSAAGEQSANIYGIVKTKANDIVQDIQAWRHGKNETDDELVKISSVQEEPELDAFDLFVDEELI
ncbi:YtxH domain-containing protein [Paenibacillus macquariensis]|nr:YtxH domain-containing protein [Paenibacillus macquariensis]MEC0089175.1 YtxH domain-containing protein [Paenibacillus macquariensis]